MGEVVKLTIERPFDELAAELVQVLNEKAGKRFPTHKRDGSLSHSALMVRRLLNDGYEFDDIRSVIAMQCRDWSGTRFQKYLRPKTLFGPVNFEQYFGNLQ